ncbi:flagellar protein FlbB, partial [Treponema pallidum]
VKILLKTDDQDVIEVFRMVDAAARQRGVNSLVPYWLSLMPPDRAAEIQRKMANKPADFP